MRQNMQDLFPNLPHDVVLLISTFATPVDRTHRIMRKHHQSSRWRRCDRCCIVAHLTDVKRWYYIARTIGDHYVYKCCQCGLDGVLRCRDCWLQDTQRLCSCMETYFLGNRTVREEYGGGRLRNQRRVLTSSAAMGINI